MGKLRHRVVLGEVLKSYRLKQNIATGHAAFEPPRDALLFATCLGVWACEHAIEKTEYRSFPGERVDDVPTNDVGENSWPRINVLQFSPKTADGRPPVFFGHLILIMVRGKPPINRRLFGSWPGLF